MHYFIDGYNMLFRLLHTKDNLQNQREFFIHDLNKKVSLIKLDVSIIFDARFQMGDRSRSHYDQLEILFSAQGETADEYILEEIKNAPYPEQETVITSDKELAWRVRNRSAHIESVEHFISRLNRAYKNKLKQLKKGKQPPSSPLSPPHFITPSSHSSIPDKNASLEDYNAYYAQIFESEWEEILKEEEIQRQSIPPPSTSKRSPRKSRRSIGPFQTPQRAEETGATEMERWLKSFEKRLTDPDQEPF